ncbi:hypothetical protein F4778DRAFT_781930 [Xylariomycetidae sp. FL2044]|nr:hypothetical protein F4778DRAFT_781930 [Xylariomycetidae sp. FL2044]
MAPFLPAALGTIGLLATSAIFALDVVLAHGLWASGSPVRIAAVIASCFEAAVVVILLILLPSQVRGSTEYGSRKRKGAWFALSIVASVLATAATVALLVSMSQTDDLPETILGTPLTNFLIGSSVALGLAFAGQLVFFVVYFVSARSSDSDPALSLHTTEDGHRTLKMRVKSIPYSRTQPANRSFGEKLPVMDYQSRPGSSRSAAETISSIQSSLANMVRPMGSQRRLLSTSSKSRRRAASIDSNSYRERSSVIENGFDSWDTSSVDPNNRQTVIDAASPVRTRFLGLETIPASPAPSRSTSPGFPLDPPERCRRSRSYSPVPRPLAQQSLTSLTSMDEQHIHPLFRSDSPVPPPAATPGTVVLAAPGAGQTISERSISRMRSGSLPTAPSPLSRQGSYDSFRKTPSPNMERLRVEDVAEERKMTPPIPEWILSAGSRTSLAEYETRKARDHES